MVGRALVIDAVADDGKQGAWRFDDTVLSFLMVQQATHPLDHCADSVETRPQALALGIIGMAKATEA